METSSETSTSLSHRTDSTVINIEKTVKPVVVPPSEAELNIPQDALNNLPAGGSFQEKSGNATVRATKQKDGTLTITASCDSLTLLVENLKQEVYHFRDENTTLKTELNEQKTQTVYEPSGWQWFQIWWGRIVSAILALWVAGRLGIKRLDMF